jgi:hypothetical protein
MGFGCASFGGEKMMKFTRFFVALFLLCFALSASAAKEDPADCTPDNSIGLWLHDYGLVPERAVDKIKLLDSQVIGETTGKGTEKYYDKGWEIKQYTHLITYPPAKKGDAPVKVIVISECAPAENTMDAEPLVYLISPVYMNIDLYGKDARSASMLNSRNVARKALQEKIKEYNKKLDELGKEQ